jgi:hypothetical protein
MASASADDAAAPAVTRALGATPPAQMYGNVAQMLNQNPARYDSLFTLDGNVIILKEVASLKQAARLGRVSKAHYDAAKEIWGDVEFLAE